MKKDVLEINRNVVSAEGQPRTFYALVDVKEDGDIRSYHVEGDTRNVALANAMSFIRENGWGKSARITGVHVLN
ncbi:hypothetical protein QB910_000015 [Dabrowskivirus KKP3916]|uniref:Uncharacterized protein n=1 Tax=Alicyclobacillus phage KKP_3916 TaxID=3040651 RepID=A0AAT9V7G0_9CAUD|nr:hypothetical protein QB910_000015 [Alicyclobacillus phage KKP 3916]